jgi:hypothetical protein
MRKNTSKDFYSTPSIKCAETTAVAEFISFSHKSSLILLAASAPGKKEASYWPKKFEPGGDGPPISYKNYRPATPAVHSRQKRRALPIFWKKLATTVRRARIVVGRRPFVFAGGLLLQRRLREAGIAGVARRLLLRHPLSVPVARGDVPEPASLRVPRTKRNLYF